MNQSKTQFLKISFLQRINNETQSKRIKLAFIAIDHKSANTALEILLKLTKTKALTNLRIEVKTLLRLRKQSNLGLHQWRK